MILRERNLLALGAHVDRHVGIMEYQAQRFARYLMAGASVKILLWPEMPVWAVFAAAPLVLLALYVGGLLWVRFGWIRQATEVDVLDNISPLQRASYWWLHRNAQALGYSLNNIPDHLPSEVEEILASSKPRKE